VDVKVEVLGYIALKVLTEGAPLGLAPDEQALAFSAQKVRVCEHRHVRPPGGGNGIPPYEVWILL
jgi:hypothetical protein